MGLLALFTSMTAWECIFWIFSIHRFLRLLVNTTAHWLYRSIPLPVIPTLSSDDVTVIVPTIENDVEELRAPLCSILACGPSKLILVTTFDRFDKLEAFARSLKDARVKVYHCRIANKRLQLREAIPKVKTSLTILVDDDVTWPKTILPWLLAPFEDKEKRFGAIGPCQKVRRPPSTASLATKCWNWLGCAYIERRNFEISATHFMDGGTSCMSGRTCAFRTEILQDPLFLDGFCNERWGSYHLNADDDNFVTRWIVSHKWKTWIQYNKECMIETTLENNPKFLAQCLRWARSNWRSNWTSLLVERHVWRLQPWSCYLIYTATFTSLGLVTDPFFLYAYYKASRTWTESSIFWGWLAVTAVYLFAKTIKLVGLFRRNPWDVFFLPVSILFGLYHGFIKVKALLTWNVTSWGSRPDGDIDDSERMSPLVLPNEVMTNPADGKPSLPRYKDDDTCESEKGDSEKCDAEDSGYATTDEDREVSATKPYRG